MVVNRGRTAQRAVLLGAFAVVAHVAPYGLSVMAYSPRRARALQAGIPRLFGIGRPGHVALTFDDGPHPEGTRQILQALDRFGWKATFFMISELAQRFPDVVQEVVDAGHEIAFHGRHHSSYMFFPLNVAVQEMAMGKRQLTDVCGIDPLWFRPPYGTLTTPALLAARSQNMHTMLWTAWGKDWSLDGKAHEIMQNIKKGRVDGGTILLHDGDSPSSPGNWSSVIKALELLSSHTNDLGVRVGPLREHFVSEQFHDRPEQHAV